MKRRQSRKKRMRGAKRNQGEEVSKVKKKKTLKNGDREGRGGDIGFVSSFQTLFYFFIILFFHYFIIPYHWCLTWFISLRPLQYNNILFSWQQPHIMLNMLVFVSLTPAQHQPVGMAWKSLNPEDPSSIDNRFDYLQVREYFGA